MPPPDSRTVAELAWLTAWASGQAVPVAMRKAEPVPWQGTSAAGMISLERSLGVMDQGRTSAAASHAASERI
jgi:hypothetical protein